MASVIYTVGHSNHDIETFLSLLRLHKVSAIADVRTHPYSRYATQFSKDSLKDSLKAAGISYVFLGSELGARSDNPLCYEGGKVQYSRLAEQPLFKEGVKRLVEGASNHRIALMCAEKDPVECHRALLVSRNLFESSIPVSHILAGGNLETHEQLESRLLAICKLPEGDMFKSREDFVKQAYQIQGNRVAYQDEKMLEEEKRLDL